jgi:2'-5' RNA ligase
VRLFFAFTPDEAARAAAAAIADQLQQRLARAGAPRGVKWVERENLHVTLRFLGEVEEARALSLGEAFTAPLAFRPFAMTLGPGGCFPPSGGVRVTWIGVGEGVEEARQVFELIDERLQPLGFEREPRPYTPHLTLGRVREMDRRHARDLREWLAEVPAVLARMHVRAVTLYRSRLSSAGPRYEAVREIALE